MSGYATAHIYAECDECGCEVGWEEVDDLIYNPLNEYDIEDIIERLFADNYGAYDIVVNGMSMSICEPCRDEVIEKCSWCGFDEYTWNDSGDSFWCGDYSFSHEHDCPEEAHQRWYRDFPDSFEASAYDGGYYVECGECGYELREIPGPASEGLFDPIIDLKVGV